MKDLLRQNVGGYGSLIRRATKMLWFDTPTAHIPRSELALGLLRTILPNLLAQ